jgi:ABC-type transporter Mla subunit MlaD
MQFLRNEIRTGLLVVITLAALVAALIYLGAPGVFVPQKKFRIYLDNASGIKQGAYVLLAGRKIGQVHALHSPVPKSERPEPRMEALVEVRVEAAASIYNKVTVQMIQNGLLGEMVIDFTNGEEASGLAPDGKSYVGKRAPTLSDAVPMVLEKIDPMLSKATQTFESLQKTSDNLTTITAEDGDLSKSFTEFRKFGVNLNEMSGPEGSLRRSMANLEKLTGDGGRLDDALANIQRLTDSDSSLAKTLRNAETFTGRLANNRDIDVSLRNFRLASERLNGVVLDLGPQLSAVAHNLEQATDTVKRQPWRLIWPTTKKYAEDGRARPPEPRLRVSAQRQTADRTSGSRK